MKGGECVHLVTHGHFWSRDEDGGHTIRSAIVENPVPQAKLMALSVIQPDWYGRSKFTFLTFSAPVT